MTRRALRTRKGPLPGWAYVGILLLVVAIVSGLPYFFAADDAQRPPADEVPIKLTLPPGVSLEQLTRADVHEIIDGDTIDVLVDGLLMRVRYYGVDTPERGDRCYREAVDRNETLAGRRVLLLRDARDQDPNGRTLRYIFTQDGTSIDATLVAEGFGEAWRQDGRYRQEIIGLEDEAKAAGRGCLW